MRSICKLTKENDEKKSGQGRLGAMVIGGCPKPYVCTLLWWNRKPGQNSLTELKGGTARSYYYYYYYYYFYYYHHHHQDD